MKDILKKNGVAFKENEPLSNHTSFRTGGPASYFAEPDSAEQLIGLLRDIKSAGAPFFIMGNGSNLLAPDKGVCGIVISMGDRFSHVCCRQGVMIEAQSGALLSKIGHFAMLQGLSGFEFAHGIPGSLGGGVYMNAGAYGGQLADVISWVQYIDENLELKRLCRDEAAFGYRESVFKHRKEWIITGAALRLASGERGDIEARMRELAQKRRDKQPLEYPSAGSTFKRPDGYFAAKLIEDCGLKGERVGGAVVSQKHAGFIVNAGNATSADVLKLMDIVRKKVFDATGVTLEPEVEELRPFTY